MTTDALVSELKQSVNSVDGHLNNRGPFSGWDAIQLLLTRATDAADSLTHLQSEVERLTRERDGLTESAERAAELARQRADDLLKVEAERDAARRELAAAQSCNEGLLERLRKMEGALRKARVAIATWPPDPTEPLDEIDATLKTEA